MLKFRLPNTFPALRRADAVDPAEDLHAAMASVNDTHGAPRGPAGAGDQQNHTGDTTMTPTMLRAMSKSLLDDVAKECAIHFNNNQEVPAQVQTGLVVLAGLGNACKAAAEAGEEEKAALDQKAMLDPIEELVRQNCITRTVDRDYNGQVAGSMVTDSGAISEHADALRTLAKHGRFRIVAEGARMVVGYWPEHDPHKTPAAKGIIVEETSHG